MIKCPKCGAENLDVHTYCKDCGCSLREAVKPISVSAPIPSPKPIPTFKVATPLGTQTGALQTSIRVPSPGMCFYHKNLPATYVCGRCGRPMCRDCAKGYHQLTFCPECFADVVPR